MSTLQTALLVALALCTLTLVAYVFSGIYTPIMTGFVAGLFLGNPAVGLQVGGICSLMDIGFYTYGGAVVPSYSLGAAIGTVVAIKSGDYNQGIIIGSVVALLGSWFDILQGMAATVFIHRCDKALSRNSIKGLDRWHIGGMSTILVTCFIPIFIGMMLTDRYTLLSDFVAKYAWFERGISVIGGILPAVGFALLLSYMNIKKYWMFLLLGFVLFAYLNLPTLGLAFIGTVVAYLYAFKVKKQDEDEEVNK